MLMLQYLFCFGKVFKNSLEPVIEVPLDVLQDVNVAKERITDLIMHEQAKRTISDQYINQLSPADVKELNDLQKKLTVSIYLERGKNEEEPKIHLEGLTRDVYSADASIRSATSVCIGGLLTLATLYHVQEDPKYGLFGCCGRSCPCSDMIEPCQIWTQRLVNQIPPGGLTHSNF